MVWTVRSPIADVSPILRSPRSEGVKMGFLDKLLGRSKATAGDVADVSKDPAGAVGDETDTQLEPEHGAHEDGEEGSHDDQTHGRSSGSAT
jgi:hypothetical protein